MLCFILLSQLPLASNFLFTIYSISNALYINQLKITEGSVETWL